VTPLYIIGPTRGIAAAAVPTCPAARSSSKRHSDRGAARAAASGRRVWAARSGTLEARRPGEVPERHRHPRRRKLTGSHTNRPVALSEKAPHPRRLRLGHRGHKNATRVVSNARRFTGCQKPPQSYSSDQDRCTRPTGIPPPTRSAPRVPKFASTIPSRRTVQLQGTRPPLGGDFGFSPLSQASRSRE